MKKRLVRIITERIARDATRPLMLRVTQDHINRGVPGDSNGCVFACSFKDHFGDTIEEAEVGTRITKIYTPGMVTRYATPGELREPIKTFDKTGEWTMAAGDYLFVPPVGTMRLGGQAKATKKSKPRPPRNHNFKGRALRTRISHFQDLITGMAIGAANV